MYQAYVYELVDWSPPNKEAMQPFDGKFFIAPLRESTQQCKLGESALYKVDILRFFANTHSNARTMAIVHLKTTAVNSDQEIVKYLRPLVGEIRLEQRSKVAWAVGRLEDQLQQASQFLRGTSTLSAKEFTCISTLQVVADAHGLAIVCGMYAEARFQRVCQSIALSCAYRSVLHKLIIALSKVGLESGNSAEKTLKEWAHFLSAYYFSEPIRQNTIELSEIYGAVHTRHKLTLLAKEATEQLQLLAKLVRLDRTEKQGHQDKRFQLRLTKLGLALAIIGLLQVVQITPKTFKDFWQGWTD